jgi:hypothetical protein
MVAMLNANLEAFFAGAVPPFLTPEFGTSA